MNFGRLITNNWLQIQQFFQYLLYYLNHIYFLYLLCIPFNKEHKRNNHWSMLTFSFIDIFICAIKFKRWFFFRKRYNAHKIMQNIISVNWKTSSAINNQNQDFFWELFSLFLFFIEESKSFELLNQNCFNCICKWVITTRQTKNETKKTQYNDIIIITLYKNLKPIQIYTCIYLECINIRIKSISK